MTRLLVSDETSESMIISEDHTYARDILILMAYAAMQTMVTSKPGLQYKVMSGFMALLHSESGLICMAPDTTEGP